MTDAAAASARAELAALIAASLEWTWAASPGVPSAAECCEDVADAVLAWHEGLGCAAPAPQPAPVSALRHLRVLSSSQREHFTANWSPETAS